ncbi:chloramphenicol acetyltransferase [Pedobacter sp. PAMC26386]|nr:chloramphenicol acetyltransferase [Pedobacter sp. PAMC26386]
MKQKVDIETWVRKEHFELFNTFDEPYYGVTVNIDCTKAYRYAKENNLSFFLYCMYQCLEAAQIIEPFKYRIEEGEVFIYDQVDAGSTIGRSNGTFGFIHLLYFPVLTEFIEVASKEVDVVKNATSLIRSPANNVIRFSSLPWINFTSISHAGNSAFKDTCPKISFGKMVESNGKRTMPMSVHVHHALVDGLHVGQFIDCLQELMNQS